MSKNFKVGQHWLTRCGYAAIITSVDGEDGDFPIEADILDRREFGPDGEFDVVDIPDDWDLVTLVKDVEPFNVTRVYIAGPIGKREDKNRPAFDAAAALYRSRGCFVINPLDIVPEGTPYHECMRIDLAAMLTCEMIVLLPGWATSKGARHECVVATLCGLTVAYIEP